MELILNEWVQQIADARTKREAAEVLAAMPVWDMGRYHDTISRRLHLRGWSDLVPYVAAMRLSMMEARPLKPSIMEALESAGAVIDALLSDDEAVSESVAHAIDAELSAIGL